MNKLITKRAAWIILVLSLLNANVSYRRVSEAWEVMPSLPEQVLMYSVLAIGAAIVLTIIYLGFRVASHTLKVLAALIK